LLVVKNGLEEKKKEKVSVFRPIARLTLDTPMSQSQLPSVKYVYPVDYKSMIGRYRTLLVINSLLIGLNPLLIPLFVFESCLSHVTQV
jgi:hypothetical protein